MLKTQVFEKGNFSSEKILRPRSSRIIEYEKPRGTKYKGPQGIVKVIVQVKRSFLWDVRYEVDENNFSKKGYFAYETQFWPLLSHMNEYGRP